MSAEVIQLRRAGQSADGALVALERHLARCKLADATKKAYWRQGRAYVAWLTGPGGEHGDALVDQVGAEAAVTAWRKSLLEQRAKPASVNQGLAAVTLLHELAGIRISVKRVRVPKPGEPDALERVDQGAVERAAARRGVRNDAIIALLLCCGPRVEEVARLALKDIAITARTGSVRFHGKGGEVRDVPIAQQNRRRLRLGTRFLPAPRGPRGFSQIGGSSAGTARSVGVWQRRRRRGFAGTGVGGAGPELSG
ncbi:tyrosine-type recombinase/integrase [Actinoplanes sp. NPDC049668]|uniref:tyrosine-type recombinase/integrase n=1 Tax=unclassified Actinoplanes TaxID=2626549 RepID=UPI0033A87C2D